MKAETRYESSSVVSEKDDGGLDKRCGIEIEMNE